MPLQCFPSKSNYRMEFLPSSWNKLHEDKSRLRPAIKFRPGKNALIKLIAFDWCFPSFFHSLINSSIHNHLLQYLWLHRSWAEEEYQISLPSISQRMLGVWHMKVDCEQKISLTTKHGRSKSLRARQTGLKSQLCLSLVLWLWTYCLNSLSLFLCKNEVIYICFKGLLWVLYSVRLDRHKHCLAQ